MNLHDVAKELLEQAAKLPMALFADEDEKRVLARYDSLHRHLPDTLPEKRFFKH